jgi:hypothetical protein
MRSPSSLPQRDQFALRLRELRQSEPYGAHLIDPDYDQIFVVPRDVMEHLIRRDIIELEREQ